MARLLPELDAGVASLIRELEERGLLETTIVWVCGEFGRTPRVMMEAPWNGGRGHWGSVFSCLVAGGGFQGGNIVGATDSKGEEVADRPVYPCDVIGSVYHLMGIDGKALLPNAQGEKLIAMPTAAEKIPSAGILNEIM